MKTILITGCSSGIGYDAATTLHAMGWQVFATCRQQSDCERLREEGLISFVLDYADPLSVAAATKQALELCDGKLDALFNNGAYATPGLVQDLSRDALREIFNTNLFGQFELINLLLPVMQKQGSGYIINCSSVLGFTALPFRGAYSATKFAMEGLTDTLRQELRDTPVHVVLIEPGPITSQIRKNSIEHFEKWIDWKNSAQRERYENKLIPRLYRDTTTPDKFELPPSAVTGKLIKILESDNPKPRYFVTTPTYISGILKRFLSTRMMDKLMAGR